MASTALGALAKPVSKDLGEFLEAKAPSLYRSTEEFISKTEAGKYFMNLYKTQYKPKVASEAAKYVMAHPNVDPAKVQQAAMKTFRKKIFGAQDELMSQVIVKSHMERGHHYAQAVADALDVLMHNTRDLTHNPGRYGANQYLSSLGEKTVAGSSKLTNKSVGEKAVDKIASWTMASRIVLPHLTQPLNLVVNSNATAVTKAFQDIFADHKASMNLAIRSGALFDELLYETKNQSWVSKFFQPGFHAVRKQQIILSAVTGKHSLLEAADKLLVDPTNKLANVQLKFLGINPTDVLKQHGVTPEMIEKAAYTMVDESMFLHGAEKTPYVWETNMATRMMSLYKHYAFRQQRLVYKALQRSYQSRGWAGVMRNAALISVAFAGAGEFIRASEQLLTQRPEPKNPNDKYAFNNRLLDDYAHTLGLGIVYGMIRSASHHAFAQQLMGPMFGTAADLAQDAVTGVRTGNYHALGRDILRRAPVAGPALANTLTPPHQSRSRSRGTIRRRHR